MIPQVSIKEKCGWFSNSGYLNDVIISSRVRISRNISGYNYPCKMKKNEEENVCNKICTAIESIYSSEDYGISKMGSLSTNDKNILLERNFITKSFSEKKEKQIILSKNNLTSCVINENDHLKLSIFTSGLAVKDCYNQIDKIDREIEQLIDYAVSFEYGYLSSEVNNIGTAMKASIMVHLPALQTTNMIEKALQAIGQIGFSTKDFNKIDAENYLPGVYLISNKFCIGQSEDDIINKLENIAYQLATFEKKTREQMLNKKSIELEDMIYRAYGILKYCKLIETKEAVRNLLLVRLGICLGLIDIPLELCTSLIFICRNSFINKQIEEEPIDEKMIKIKRAEFIKHAIKNKKI